MKVSLSRLDDAFHMQALTETGHTLETDAGEKTGGHNLAARPMQMVLAAMGSCSSIDVIYLLKKQRQVLDDIKIEIDAKRDEEAVAKVFTDIHIHYKLYGDLDEKKAERAVRLSMETMCSVSLMLAKAANITWSHEIVKDGER